MMEKLKKFILSDGFRELVVYGIVGVLTTVINYVVYLLTSGPLGINPAITLAWLLSVLFAYWANKVFVFKNNAWRGKALVKEILSFFAARLLSLGFDYGFVNAAVAFWLMDDRIAKLLSNIIVIILNYFASKLIIFKKK